MLKIKFNQRIVVTCTTLPDRYDTLIKTLKSMHEQDCYIDQIYVTIPYKAKRLNKIYPEPPADIINLCKIIRIKKDYGPLSKIYGALHQEYDNDTIIISIDDDCLYPSNLISHLVKLSINHPDVVICGTGALIGHGILMASIHSTLQDMKNLNFYSGFRIPNEGRCVDVIHGFAGVLYKRCFFPKHKKLKTLFNLPFINHDVFCHDDLIISGYLRQRGIKLKTFKNIPMVVDYYKTSDALCSNFIKMVEVYKRALYVLQQHGLFLNFEQAAIDENPLMRTIYFIFLIIISIIFFFVLKRL
jgi:hypothetical protein